MATNGARASLASAGSRTRHSPTMGTRVMAGGWSVPDADPGRLLLEGCCDAACCPKW